MTVHLVFISYEDVFKRYSKKYNIYRDLYEKDLLGLEIRNLPKNLEDFVRKTVIQNKEICYATHSENEELVDFLALGSLGIFREVANGIVSGGKEDIGLKIRSVIRNFNSYHNTSFKIGNREFSMDESYVMGILNVTPDSFSDGGKYYNSQAAIDHALKMVNEGADFIDIGGESSRPGADPVTADDEIKRVIPVIEAVLKENSDVIISVDTTKSNVAKQALSNGALIVNDISGLSYDDQMLHTIKEQNASLIIMHMKGTPKTMQQEPFYDDVVSEVYDYLNEKVAVARKAGIKNIFVDPGIGFGKRVADNYTLLKRLKEFQGLGCPILIGVSNKSFMGKALNLNVDMREQPTLVTETIASLNGAKIIRTHNVKNAVMTKKLINFIDNPELVINV